MVINQCKNTYNDYRWAWSTFYPPRYDLRKLTFDDCLCGHFEPGLQPLALRYPKVFGSKHKLISFVRDPLFVAVSYSRYKGQDLGAKRNVLSDLSKTQNFLAFHFQVTEQNYKKVLDSYEFIGVLEYPEESLDALKRVLGAKHNLTMKQMNASKQGLPQMTNDVIEGFRAQNDLDYKIYDYCRMKLLERDK